MSDDQIRAVLDEFVAGYANKDADALIALFDEQAVVFGTGADEVREGRDELAEQLRRDFEQSGSLAFDPGHVSVGSAGDAGWIATPDAVVSGDAGGRPFSMTIRGTLVLRRSGDGWRIVHSHISTPTAEQAEGESFVAG